MALNFDQSRLLQKRAEKLIPGGVNSPVRAFRLRRRRSALPGSRRRRLCLGRRRQPLYRLRWLVGTAHFGPLRARRDRRHRAAARKGTSFGASTPTEADLAVLVTEAFPAVEKVRFVSSGTEATMSAIRLARAYTNASTSQVRGLLPRPQRRPAGESWLGVATLGIPGSAGVPEEFVEFTLALPYNDLGAWKRRSPSSRARLPASSSSLSWATWAVCRPSPAISKDCAPSPSAKVRADPRRSDDRFPPRLWRRVGALQHQGLTW